MAIPFYLPKEAGNTRIFTPQGAGFQPYNIPIGAQMLQIICCGAGGPGGAGFTRAAAAAGGGGGGGGSGAFSRLIIPTYLLPDTIWVSPGQGALTGNGGDSNIMMVPSVLAAHALIRALGGAAGGNGTGAAVGTAGAGGAVSTVANSGPYTGLGTYIAIAGHNAGAGGAVAGGVGGANTFGSAGIPVMGGAGGAGTTSADFAGGAITGAGLVPSSPGGAAGSNRGLDGYESWKPPSFSAGSGGGSSNTLAGGAGGAGAFGCGGGGGGAGTTGGAGGRGGNGFIIITHIF